MYRVFLLLLAHSHLDNAQDSSVTDVSKKQQSLCVLPPYPANGNYTVVNQLDARPGDGLQALYLVYSCHQGNTLIGDRDVHCINNVWTSEVPRCEIHTHLDNAQDSSIEKQLQKQQRLCVLPPYPANGNYTVVNKSDARPGDGLQSLELMYYCGHGSILFGDQNIHCDNNIWSAQVPRCENRIVCVKDNIRGVCRFVRDCKSAIREVVKGKHPRLCSFQGLEPVVCCLDDTAPAIVPLPRKDDTEATEDDTPSYDYEYPDNDARDRCEPIPASLTSQATGREAWDKCIEYQTKYVYPCQKSLSLGENKIRVNHCGHDTEELDQRGTSARAGQFPHMVLLGYGNDTDTAEWLCGGSIISEKFVLTAAQCAMVEEHGKVKFVRTAVVRRSDPLDPKRLFRVARIINHPEYKYSKYYNDIAVLETHTEMLLDHLATPACLPVGDGYNDTRAVAIGFGAVGFRGDASDTLQTVTVNKLTTEYCSDNYRPTRRNDRGFHESTQLCYGDKVAAKGTCQGDSGGPLHIYNKDVHCMYTVIGIISFDYGCGIAGVPGVYTRVAAYVRWIEYLIWPI